MWNLYLALSVLAVIVFRAVGDSYVYKRKKIIGKRYWVFLNLSWVFALYCTPRIHDLSILICTFLFYGLLKFAIFNPLYNILAGHHWSYVGTTSDTDKIESELDIRIALAGRIVSLAMAVIIFYFGIVSY